MAVVYAARLPGEPQLRSWWYRVIAPVCVDPYDYWQGLADLWDGPDVLVNLEHDSERSDQLVAELVDCPHPVCTHAYRIYFPTTHQHEPKFAHSRSLVGDTPPLESVVRYTARGIEWIGEGVEWADFSGLGFCKIAPEARLPGLLKQPWQGLEMSVNAAINHRWHVHWPEVKHFHE